MEEEFQYRPMLLIGEVWHPLNRNHPAPYRTKAHARTAISWYRRYVSKSRTLKIERRPIGVWEDDEIFEGES